MRVRIAGFVCAVLVLAAAGAARAAPLDFDPCRGTPDYECASLDVPLDPSGAVQGRLTLHVRRLVETRDAPEVLVALAGGPGQSSTDFIEDFADVLAEGLENRQLVVLDTRGTGGSGPLVCSALRDVSPAASARSLLRPVGRCGNELGPSRRYYTTSEVVEDLDALRSALEAERISLFGISYGSYVAQRYARRFPSRTDRLVLDSPVGQAQGGAFNLSSYAAVGRALRELCARGRCRGVTRDPVADLRALVRRLGRKPLRGRIFTAQGKPSTLRLGAQAELFDLLVSSDFSPALRGALPAAVRSAVRGDAAPLLRLVAIDNGSVDPREFDEQNENPAEFSNALFFATTCQEKPVPWGSAAAALDGRRERRNRALAELPASAFSPFGRGAAGSTQVGTAFCERWPPTEVAPVPAADPIDAPALVLSGSTDLRTPMREARGVAARISDASLVRVPGAGHSLVSSRLACVQTALTRFFADEAVGNPCAGQGALNRSIAPRAPRRLRDLSVAGLRGRGRRVVAGALATLADAVRVAAIQGVLDRPYTFGGLRGGAVCVRPGQARPDGSRTLVLRPRRASLVPGFDVSGRAIVAGRRVVAARLSTSGSATVRNRLRLRGRRLTGRVRGRRVSLRVPVSRLAVPRPSIAPALASGRRLGCA